ncbi:molybdopterin biosynthesis enzyme [Nitrobacteraceae bacterium AZCC 2146]
MSLSLTVRQGLFLAEDVSAVVRITQPQFVKTAFAGAAFDRDLAFASIVA